MKLTITRKISYWGFLIILLWSMRLDAQETIVHDKVIDWGWERGDWYGGNTFYWWHRPREANVTDYGDMSRTDWISPYNYRNGTFYLRFEVLSQPSNESFHIQFGIWQDYGKAGGYSETVSALATLSGGSGSIVETSIGSPRGWWQKRSDAKVDFRRPEDFYRIGILLWNKSPLCLPMAQGWNNSNACSDAENVALRFFPMKARVTVVAVAEGHTFSGWKNYRDGGAPPPPPPPPTNEPRLGNATVYNSTTKAANRRATQVTASENGTIESISIYHNGGGGSMLMGVYADASGSPGSRLGITSTTTVSSSAGWQTVKLRSPVAVAKGQTVWLAWVFQSNPGIRYTTGTPARAQSTATWSGGLPTAFGSSSMANYKYSLYCSYTPGGSPDYMEVSPTSLSLGSGSGSTGSFDISSNTTWNVSDNAGWLSVSSTSGSNNGTITCRATSANTGTSSRSATVTVSGNGVSNKTVTVTQSPASSGSGSTVGNTNVFGSTTKSSNRRAVQATFSESGTIQSISIYHNGGGGNMLLGIYADASGAPGSRLGITPTTAVKSSSGWQTVNLSSPVSVNAGQTVWLAWVFQSNPGIRYTSGSPARAHSSATWSGGMPSSFGSSSMANYRYSLYCTYTPGGSSSGRLGNQTVYGSTTKSANRRAVQVTASVDCSIQSISMYHNGGGGSMLMGVYTNASGAPGSRLGVTPTTTVRSSAGWQTVKLSSPVSVKAGQTVWLAWVFQSNPGIRYSSGSPARAHSSATWSGGMPSSFGSSSMANYKYSLYCNYTTGGTKATDENLTSEALLGQQDPEDQFTVYPNPTHDRLYVSWNHAYERGLILTLINSVGESVRILNLQPNQSEVELDLSDYNPGLYLLMINDPLQERTIHRAKVIKNE